ncbi:hypothetical protein F750_5925 [Streptomyces sp. PAMC 26508]|nr:hypothetical protein F750_5925 [Streptomyces sp. PAMC 26508]
MDLARTSGSRARTPFTRVYRHAGAESLILFTSMNWHHVPRH